MLSFAGTNNDARRPANARSLAAAFSCPYSTKLLRSAVSYNSSLGGLKYQTGLQGSAPHQIAITR